MHNDEVMEKVKIDEQSLLVAVDDEVVACIWVMHDHVLSLVKLTKVDN